YLLISLSAAAGAIVWLHQTSAPNTPLRPRFGGLLASAALFLVGGAYMGVASATFGLSALPGEMLLIAGFVVMGWNIARYGALLNGEVVTADFRAFGLSTLAVVVLYAALLQLGPPAAGWPIGERRLLFIVLS